MGGAAKEARISFSSHTVDQMGDAAKDTGKERRQGPLPPHGAAWESLSAVRSITRAIPATRCRAVRVFLTSALKDSGSSAVREKSLTTRMASCRSTVRSLFRS